MKRVLDDHFIIILILSALIIISTMLLVHAVTYRPERYSSMGLADENNQLSEFPDSIAYNDTLPMYFNIINNERKAILYQVRMYYGDASTTVDPNTGEIPVPVREQWSRVVGNGNTWARPISITFNASHIGLKKIIFSTWMLDSETGNFFYSGLNVHFWLDIQAP